MKSSTLASFPGCIKQICLSCFWIYYTYFVFSFSLLFTFLIIWAIWFVIESIWHASTSVFFFANCIPRNCTFNIMIVNILSCLVLSCLDVFPWFIDWLTYSMSEWVSKGVSRGMTFNNVRLTMAKGIPKSLYLKTK